MRSTVIDFGAKVQAREQELKNGRHIPSEGLQLGLGELATEIREEPAAHPEIVAVCFWRNVDVGFVFIGDHKL